MAYVKSPIGKNGKEGNPEDLRTWRRYFVFHKLTTHELYVRCLMILQATSLDTIGRKSEKDRSDSSIAKMQELSESLKNKSKEEVEKALKGLTVELKYKANFNNDDPVVEMILTDLKKFANHDSRPASRAIMFYLLEVYEHMGETICRSKEEVESRSRIATLVLDGGADDSEVAKKPEEIAKKLGYIKKFVVAYSSFTMLMLGVFCVVFGLIQGMLGGFEDEELEAYTRCTDEFFCTQCEMPN